VKDSPKAARALDRTWTYLRSAVIAWALIGATPTRAADSRAQARALAAEATRLYEAGRYDEAAARLGAAHDLVPSPKILYNLARCMQKADRLEEAVALYGRYLETIPAGAKERAAVQAVIAKLSERVGRETATATVTSEPRARRCAWTAGDTGSVRARPAQ